MRLLNILLLILREHIASLKRRTYIAEKTLNTHPYQAANQLRPGSYVSLQAALSHYGLIPEAVYNITSITIGKTEMLTTSQGLFLFRHVQAKWFHSYRRIKLGSGQFAYVATPEKALLDLIYLEPDGDKIEYLRHLRLQALDILEVEILRNLAQMSNQAKLMRAFTHIVALRKDEMSLYEDI